jgi:hypothetical protein
MALVRRGYKLIVSGSAGGIVAYSNTGSSWIPPSQNIQAMAVPVASLSSATIAAPWDKQEEYNSITPAGYFSYWLETSPTIPQAEEWAATFGVIDSSRPWSISLEVTNGFPRLSVTTATNALLGADYFRGEIVSTTTGWTSAELSAIPAGRGIVIPLFLTQTNYTVDDYFDQAGFSTGSLDAPFEYQDAELIEPLTLSGQANLQSISTATFRGDLAVFVNATATTQISATTGIIQSASASLASQTQISATSAVTVSVAEQYSSISQTAADASRTAGASADLAVETALSSLASVTLGSPQQTLQVETQVASQPGLVIDIGEKYAVDWVEEQPLYVEPTTNQEFLSETNAQINATLIFFLEGAIRAESQIVGEGGYLVASGNLIYSGQSTLEAGQIVFGTQAGLIFDGESQVASETQAVTQANLIPGFLEFLTAETNLSATAEVQGTIKSDMFSQFEQTTVPKLFVGPEIPLLSSTSDIFIEGGYRLDSQANLFSQSQSRIIAKIISLDEYYVDRVEPENRIRPVQYETRKMTIDSDLRKWVLFPEDRIAQAPEEIRINKPELGIPVQQAKRIRRITA